MTFAEYYRQEGRQEGRQVGRHEGIEEGIEKGILMVAGSMLKQGFSPEVIALTTNLPVEKIYLLKTDKIG